MISLPWLEIFLLRRIANAAEELETYDTSSEVPEIVNNIAADIYVVCQKTLPRVYRKKQQT